MQDVDKIACCGVIGWGRGVDGIDEAFAANRHKDVILHAVTLAPSPPPFQKE